jgi:hypothetical protein
MPPAAAAGRCRQSPKRLRLLPTNAGFAYLRYSCMPTVSCAAGFSVAVGTTAAEPSARRRALPLALQRGCQSSHSAHGSSAFGLLTSRAPRPAAPPLLDTACSMLSVPSL